MDIHSSGKKVKHLDKRKRKIKNTSRMISIQRFLLQRDGRRLAQVAFVPTEGASFHVFYEISPSHLHH